MDKDQKRRELIEDIDLDQNDLEAALSNAGKLWDKGGNQLTIVILIAALAFMSYRLWGSYTTSVRENGLTELAIETSPAGFRRVAEDYSAVGVRTRALLAAGDTALNEAVQLDPITAGPDRDAVLAEAQDAYDTLLAMDVPAVYLVNARLGLASVAETRGEWEDAANHYAAAQEAAGEDFAFLAALAASRAEMLDDIRRPVAFAAPDPTLPTGLEGTGLPTLDNPDLAPPSIGDSADPFGLNSLETTIEMPGEDFARDRIVEFEPYQVRTPGPAAPDSTPADESAP